MKDQKGLSEPVIDICIDYKIIVTTIVDNILNKSMILFNYIIEYIRAKLEEGEEGYLKSEITI